MKRKQSKINIPDNYSIHTPMSQAAFSEMVGVNRSTTARNVKAGVVKARKGGSIYLIDNYTYLVTRKVREQLNMTAEQLEKMKNLIADVMKREPAAAPEPEAAPVRPYNHKALESEMFYHVGIFQDESFCPLVRLYTSEPGEGVELQPLEVGYIFQIDRKGKLENIFLDAEGGPAGELFMQEIDVD